MKPFVPACLLFAVCLVSVQGAESGKEPDKELLLRAFSPAASQVLDQPFTGLIRAAGPGDVANAKPEHVSLNFLNPADTHQGYSPINTPYLAISEDGRSCMRPFALRPKLPETKELVSFSSYKEILDLLGPPTQLPFSGQTDDKWAYDMVSWRLFTPLSADGIEVLELNVGRKSPLGDSRDEKHVIESYSVSRGTLTKGKPSGTGEPAVRPELKPEDAKPESKVSPE